MNLEEKYEKWVEVYKKYFIHEGDPDISGNNIPLESVRFKDGKAIVSNTGDGTINIAHYLTWRKHVNCNSPSVSGYLNIKDTLKSLKRLSLNAYKYFVLNFHDINRVLPFKHEKGFFLRDDIKTTDACKFNSESIISSYTRGIELVNEDPCHSTYVSQDQIWNLLPILYTFSSLYFDITFKQFACDILKYVIDGNHIIYNPYYSTIKHFWTYVPELNGSKLPFNQRAVDRANTVKYDVKVKRGAYNWYFAYGFRKAYEKISGNKLNKFKNFLYGLWYIPFTFLADRVYYPIMHKWVKRKETSFYSLGFCGCWYGFNYNHRLIKRFNKSLKEWDKDNTKELFMPQLISLTDVKAKDINKELLQKWLESYPEPNLNGNIQSPIMFMILYEWDKYISDDRNS